MRWTLKDNKIVGAIMLNASKYIWPVRQLIETTVDISDVLNPDIGKADLHISVPQASQTLF